ncbi:MAG: hypothetical protein HYX90_06385 [Chloroflexi bacterium]|nr:hypothetical protein [Chloroflexota bacterium]
MTKKSEAYPGLPPVTPPPSADKHRAAGWPSGTGRSHSMVVPAVLICFVLALSTTLIFGIVARGPDTHANLWNTVRDGYYRTEIGYVSSEAGPSMDSLPLIARAQAATTQIPGTTTPTPPPTTQAAKDISFSSNVLPLLKANCQACHGPSVAIKGISLASYDSVISSKLVEAGNAEASRLIDVLRNRKGVLMPPLGAMSEDKIKTIEDWIKQGAKNN